MMEWKEVKLDSLVNRKICYGIVQAGPPLQNGVPIVKVQNIVQGLDDISSLDKTSDDISNQYKRTILKGGELLITLVGTVGLVDIAPKDFAGANIIRNVGLLDITDNNIKQWVKYYIRTREGQHYIMSNLNTTVQKALNIKELCAMPIPMPSESYMQKAVSFLSSLDSKIETNNKINAKLEEMAQALFKSWFVDFEPFKDKGMVESELGMIPKGWRVGKIGDINTLVTDYVSNGSFASLKANVQLYETKEYSYFIRNTDLKSNSFSIYVDKHSYEFLAKSRLFGDEIIISNVGDVGSVFLCPKLDGPMTLGNNIIMLRPKEYKYTHYLYLWYKKFAGQALIQGIKGGSAQPKFNKTDFKNLPLLLPNDEVIEKISPVLKSFFDKIQDNIKENSRLSQLRDTLLPKLMSGEIDLDSLPQ